MSWLALILVGVIILAIGHYAPMPPPLPIIARIVGWVLVIWGVLVLILALTSGSALYLG